MPVMWAAPKAYLEGDSMKINLSYSKPIKVEKYPDNSVVEVPDKCTVRDLISTLGIPKNQLISITIYVNDEPVWNSTVLKENDSVKLIPVVGAGWKYSRWWQEQVKHLYKLNSRQLENKGWGSYTLLFSQEVLNILDKT